MHTKHTIAFLMLAATLIACGGDDTDDAGFSWPSATADAVATHALIVEASYADSLATAQDLDAALEAFVADPTDTTLSDARMAWLDSREPYLQTEAYRFYDGPIDNPDDGPEGLINAWPLDENYIDYVEGDETAGIINGTDTIDAATLESLNEVGGEKNIATGYHAIEFLLWGQDRNVDSAGMRPHTDYLTGDDATAPNADRRALYLTTVGDLLVTHLGQVHDAWAPGAAYRTEFEANPEDAFRRILTGMIILSGFETGGERLQAALDSGDQEDEHSCFSDNTHRDMIADIIGIQNVWEGRYVRVDGSVVEGTSVESIVAAVDADLAQRLDERITESLRLANAMGVPFDQQIVPGAAGNQAVMDLVISLKTQEELLFEVFDTFELTVSIPE